MIPTCRWRDNLKCSSENYSEFKVKDALRKRLDLKKAELTEEQKENIKRGNRERQRRFRERRKNLYSQGKQYRDTRKYRQLQGVTQRQANFDICDKNNNGSMEVLKVLTDIITCIRACHIGLAAIQYKIV